MSTAYDAVLFDFDGVLADTEPVHRECWAEVLAPYGIDLDWETYVRHCVGVSDCDMVDFLRSLAPQAVEAATLFGEYPRKKSLFRERTRLASPISQETRALVSELARTYRLAVVSSSGRLEIEPLLERAGIRDFLSTVVCGDDVERHKPAPDPYLLAARRMEIGQALVVEDSEAGCASGRAAGFDVLRVSSARETARMVRERLVL